MGKDLFGMSEEVREYVVDVSGALQNVREYHVKVDGEIARF